MNFIKKSVRAITVSLLSISIAHAGIEGEMSDLFGSMTTVTPPTANINSTQRGVIGFGGISIKNKISNPSIVSWVPPSFEAGCGGIDLYGGSFSFINAAQFQQLLRNISSQATGYAFQLALDTMCGSCLVQLNALQKKIQKFNQFFSNSCQLAQGIVNDTVASKINADHTKFSTASISQGFDDLFDGFTTTDGDTPLNKADTNDTIPDCHYNTNMLWCEMAKSSMTSWFTNGDKALAEAIMSLTGTIIVGEKTTAPDGQGDQPEMTPIPPNGLKVRDLLEGGEVNMITCTNTNCTTVSYADKTITGLQTLVLEMLTGNSTSAGIISKYASNTDALTDKEKKFLTNMPGGYGGMIRNLSANDPASAYEFAHAVAPFVAMDMVSVIFEDLLQAASSASAKNQSGYGKDLRALIVEARKTYHSQLADLRAKHGDSLTIRTYYTNILKTIRSKRYALDLVEMGLNTPDTGAK